MIINHIRATVFWKRLQNLKMNFAEAWTDYSGRFHGRRKLAKYLQRELSLEKVMKECLTIGPGKNNQSTFYQCANLM